MKQTNILTSLRRMLLVLLLVAAVSATATAQTGLSVDQVFKRFGKAKGCKMVTMRNAELNGFVLNTYKSLVYKSHGDLIEPYLDADRKKARKVREVVEDGEVTGGYYMMQPLGNGINRYILFSSGSRGGGTVIYIEGALSPDDIMQLCYYKR